MKTKFRILLAAITFIASLALLFAALAVPGRLAAQDKQDHSQDRNRRHHHYKLIDIGTFGGPTSYFTNGLDGILNNHGMAAGWADTSTPDPVPSFCYNQDCFVSHAFQWQSGVLTDLGTLVAGWSSSAFWISGNGLIVGNSQNGEIDPLIPGFPEFRAVLWQKGGISDLGTLEGGYESLAGAVNNRGQVVGAALNTIPDPFCLLAPGFCTTQTRAFRWQNGAMHDLGTLGTGNDASASFINEHGQIAGISYINTTPNPVTGLPTQDPFLWQNGTMLDLGTLGGTLGSAAALNNRGEVVGQSNLAGDLIFHPFLWTKSSGMQDLGTFGGDTGTTEWINDAGEVVGKADLPGSQTHDAFLWKSGVLTDLGTLPGDACSLAYQVNSRGQVVGTSEDQTLCSIPTGEHAFLWEHGGTMVDLNSLIPPGSGLSLVFAFAINNRGEIAGTGVPPGCSPPDVETCGHAFLLIPCDENHPGLEGCDYSMVEAPAAVPQTPPAVRKASSQPLPQSLLRGMSRYHFPGRAFSPKG